MTPANTAGLSRRLCTAMLGLAPAAALALASFGAEAQTYLRFATAQAPESVIQQRVYGAWADAVNEASGGALDITSYPPPFATATNIWDRVTAGVADMGIVALPNTGLQIAASYVTSLPGMGGDPEAASIAMWNLYEQGLLEEALGEVKVLGFQTIMPLSLYSREPITTMEQLNGMRVRATDRYTANALSLLGASPTSIPFNETYQAISRGVVDASLGSGNSLVVFRFRELLDHQVTNVSFGMTPFVVIMNRDTWDRLSDEERAVIEEWSGEHLSRFLGDMQNVLRDEFDEDLYGSGDVTPHELSEAELARWSETIRPVIDSWIGDTPNGQAILDAYLAAYEQVVASD